MVRHFGFGVDAVEDNTGLNALAVAVNKGDLHLTEFLVTILNSWYQNVPPWDLSGRTRIARKADCTQECHLLISMKHH